MRSKAHSPKPSLCLQAQFQRSQEPHNPRPLRDPHPQNFPFHHGGGGARQPPHGFMGGVREPLIRKPLARAPGGGPPRQGFGAPEQRFGPPEQRFGAQEEGFRGQERGFGVPEPGLQSGGAPGFHAHSQVRSGQGRGFGGPGRGSPGSSFTSASEGGGPPGFGINAALDPGRGASFSCSSNVYSSFTCPHSSVRVEKAST